jgi:hypothetical protein
VVTGNWVWLMFLTSLVFLPPATVYRRSMESASVPVAN